MFVFSANAKSGGWWETFTLIVRWRDWQLHPYYGGANVPNRQQLGSTAPVGSLHFGRKSSNQSLNAVTRYHNRYVFFFLSLVSCCCFSAQRRKILTSLNPDVIRLHIVLHQCLLQKKPPASSICSAKLGPICIFTMKAKIKSAEWILSCRSLLCCTWFQARFSHWSWGLLRFIALSI